MLDHNFVVFLGGGFVRDLPQVMLSLDPHFSHDWAHADKQGAEDFLVGAGVDLFYGLFLRTLRSFLHFNSNSITGK